MRQLAKKTNAHNKPNIKNQRQSDLTINSTERHQPYLFIHTILDRYKESVNRVLLPSFKK